MTHRVGIACVSLLVLACAQDRARENGDAPQVPNPPVASYTLDDFDALRYLEGDWRGSGYSGGPFFESYRFVNDSTIEMTAWTDSTLSVQSERKHYQLRNGIIQTDDGGTLVSVDDEGHHFQRGSTSWTFRQASRDQWTATVGPTTTYTMDRIRR